MIRIEKIRIHEFRGIRDLTLELKGANFAACGPNGTGKSGIVDAVEFALTGQISRLSGSGTGGLSIKLHGPHVDSRDTPEKATVTLDVSIPSLGGKNATIQRCVKTAGTPVITPASPNVLAAFDAIRRHPEFVLSRRELIRYVLSEPGQRAKEVQALLRLDDVEKLRAALQKISNATAKEIPPLERFETAATNSLSAALGVAQLSKSAILSAVNPRRELLGLPALPDFDAESTLDADLGNDAGAVASGPVAKAQAAADLEAIRTAMAVVRSEAYEQARTAAATMAEELADDAIGLDGLSRESLLRSALDLYDETVCPVCDTPFEPEVFRAHLAEKLRQLDAITAKKTKLEAQIAPLLDNIHALGSGLATVIEYAGKLPAVDVATLSDAKGVLAGRYGQLKKILPLGETLAVLRADQRVVELDSVLDTFATAVAALPEPSSHDAAKAFLIIAQERLTALREARKLESKARARAGRAAHVFKVFGEVSTRELETIYKQVETAFSDCYREINRDDESTFSAKLEPSLGKLGFDVDFYGRGHFPPGAYHSEGHQDGMGLCLYLSLMSHLLGDGFTLAVLDDVLMSVDAGHRREVCRLLKQQFPNTQFIFTTHDEIWLRHMRSEGLVKGRNFAHFRTWSVDLGPTEWDARDVWVEIDCLLAKNDVRAAAALLRHYLEHFSKDACDRLRASVEFRGDAQFVMSDILPAATGALGDLLKKAKVAANSWGQKDVMMKIATREANYAEARTRTYVDLWQVNAAVHFNAWADFHRHDFEPVVEAFKVFTGAFVCPTCEEAYYVSPERGTKESLRCGCGAINLMPRPKST